MQVPSLRLLSLLSIVNQNSHSVTKKGFGLVLSGTESENDFRLYKDYANKMFIDELASQSLHSLNLDEDFERLKTLKTMKDDIRKKAIRYQGYVFGGHVRDFILGYYATMRHINIMFVQEWTLKNFVNCLMIEYNVIICDSINCHDMISFAMATTSYIQHRTYPELIIPIDIVLEQYRFATKLSIEKTDFDVNMLYFDLSDKIATMTHKSHTFKKQKIYKNILAKQFIVIPSCGINHNNPIGCYDHTPHKLIKLSGAETYIDTNACIINNHEIEIREKIRTMQSKGWIMLNNPCPNSECVLCPENIKLETKKRNEFLEVQWKNKLLEEIQKLKQLKESNDLEDNRNILALKGKIIWDDESDNIINIINFERNRKSKIISKRKANKENIKWRNIRLVNKGHIYQKK
jgi:hypothetical protein